MRGSNVPPLMQNFEPPRNPAPHPSCSRHGLAEEPTTNPGGELVGSRTHDNIRFRDIQARAGNSTHSRKLSGAPRQVRSWGLTRSPHRRRHYSPVRTQKHPILLIENVEWEAPKCEIWGQRDAAELGLPCCTKPSF